MASHRHKTIPRGIMGNQRSCRCKFKTKFILEVPNMFKGIWLWMWEVDRVIFCPVAWSIPFSSGMGLPLLIISRLDWKSSFENCFSARWCFEPSPSSSRQRLPGRWSRPQNSDPINALPTWSAYSNFLFSALIPPLNQLWKLQIFKGT